MCEHTNLHTETLINVMKDTGRRMADIAIYCRDCGVKMRFLGLPVGLNMNGAAVNPSGTELRVAIHPRGEPVPPLPVGEAAGFRLRRLDPENN